MTSKSLFFKLMREDTKRRLWVVALSVITFFFTFPVKMAMMISEYTDVTNVNDLGDFEKYQAYGNELLQAYFLEWIAPWNELMFFLICVLAILCAVSGFSYLHSRKKTDFFHSLPLRREILFAAPFISGILYTAIPYLISLMLSALIVQIKIGSVFSWGSVFTGYLVHMSFFILIYATVTLAVILTGNTIVSLLGTLVFFIWAPCIIVLMSGYHQEYFTTFYQINRSLEELAMKLSPIPFYVKSVGNAESMLLNTVIALVIAALLTLFTVVLYKRRPSEAAGRAMAFRKSQAVIKFLIVVPSALFGSLLMRQMRDSAGWSVFGLLCGLILSYCVIEIIYNFDFRRLFCHRLQLALCTVVSFGVLAFFYFDLSGFDSYLPSADKIESSAVLSDKLDGDAAHMYRTSEQLKEYNNGKKHYLIQEYGDNFQILKEMRLTDSAPVLAIASEGIKLSKEQDSNYYRTFDLRAAEKYNIVLVKYVLKGGKEVYRRYFVAYDPLREAFASVYQQKEYKEAVYPILKEDISNIAGINYQEYGDYKHVKLSDEAMKEKLLNTYQEELLALSTAVRSKESPIAALQFKTLEVQSIIDLLKSEGDTHKYLRFNERNYYPVYPSFTRTIGLLKECGIDVGTLLSSNHVAKIELTWERSYSHDADNNEAIPETVNKYGTERESLIFKDKDQIEQILKASISADLSLNMLNEIYDNVDVAVFVPFEKLNVTDEELYEMKAEEAEKGYSDHPTDQSGGGEYRTYRVYLDQDKLPAFVKEGLKGSLE